MTQYAINLKYLNNDKNEKLFFFDNSNNKKIKDIKEFINSFNNSICSCMIDIPNYKYNGDTELKLISKNSTIDIKQILATCT